VSEHSVELIRCKDNDFVEAKLHNDLLPTDLFLVDEQWSPYRIRLIRELLDHDIPDTDWPESLRWNWSRKAYELKLLAASGFGVMCENEWQGTMLTKTAPYFARLPEDEGKPLVYVDYVETAPWNWRVEPIDWECRYKGVGSILLRQAVIQSLDEGFHGRLGLHALPQAEGYYRDVMRMTAVGRDPLKQNLLYFEFSRWRAVEFLGD